MGGWMDGWVDAWMNGWIDGWMDGWSVFVYLFLYFVFIHASPDIIFSQNKKWTTSLSVPHLQECPSAFPGYSRVEVNQKAIVVSHGPRLCHPHGTPCACGKDGDRIIK